MNEDPIGSILSGDYRSLETGETLWCPIASLTIAPTLEGRERELLEGLGLACAPTIVCDPNTHDVLAKRVADAVPNAKLDVIEAPEADQDMVDRLIDRTRHADVLIAVGAGTLNDLVKYVSHLRKQPYAVFATAPSMNGYVTTTASITRKGEKLSLPATPPRGAFFDLTVLAEAPWRLICAGVGDSLCRTTAEIDWLISHHLLDTPYIETPFAIQANDEADLIARIGDLASGDEDAVTALVRLLILGGLGMLIAGSSQPGSQGEHLISHYMDMMHKPHPGSLHGEQVGLATRTMAMLQHHVLTQEEPPVLSETTIDATDLKARFGPRSAACDAAMRAKALNGDRLDVLNRRLSERWSILKTLFEARAVPLQQLQDTFDIAGVAAAPEDLGITSDLYKNAVLHARELRDRFTMLDVAADAGMLEPFVIQHLAYVSR